MTTDPATAPVFDRAGKYRLGPQLGAGGMAEVHRGWIVGQSGVERLVAIKRILPGQIDHNPHLRELFVNEARLAARLHHANIVQMIDFDQDAQGRLFQVMEFVDGCDLEKLARTVPVAGLLPVSVSCYVIAQVLRALDYAYNGENPETGGQLGIVHRDATPSNVMLSWAGDVKLTDLGVAKAVLATQATTSGRLTGKPAYMSPEQVRGEILDGRSDVFAAGVMLWELLTGHRLFIGDTIPSIIAQVIQYAAHARRVDPPHLLNPGVPTSLSTIVAQLLAPDRDDRPADAGAACDLLRQCSDVRMADAPELADLLAVRFQRAAHRPSRRTSSASAATPTVIARGTATREQMRAPTRVLPAESTPMAGQMTGAPAPRGARIGLAVAGALLAAVGIGIAVLVASDDSGSMPAAPAAGEPPRQAGIPDVAVPPDAPPSSATGGPDATEAVAPQSQPAGGTPEAPSVLSSADAGTPETMKPRPRRPRTQIREVNLGSE
jgi:serine/threonine protein kinase